MVTTDYIYKILKQLEKYLIKKSNYELKGDSYNLILLIASDSFNNDAKYSLILSSKRLNTLNQKVVINELFIALREILSSDEFTSISRINVIHSDDPFVRNINFTTVSPFDLINSDEIKILENITIGGVNIQFAYLMKAFILSKLIKNKKLIIQLPSRVSFIAQVIRIDSNFEVTYYTEKGINEITRENMWQDELLQAKWLKQQTENYLLEQQYIGKISFDNILGIYDVPSNSIFT